MSLGPNKPPGTTGGGHIDQLGLIASGGLRDKFQPPSFGLPLSHEGTYITYMAFFFETIGEQHRSPTHR